MLAQVAAVRTSFRLQDQNLKLSQMIYHVCLYCKNGINQAVTATSCQRHRQDRYSCQLSARVSIILLLDRLPLSNFSDLQLSLKEITPNSRWLTVQYRKRIDVTQFRWNN